MLLAVLLLLAPTTDGEAGGVSFQRDILPVLSDRCFPCHGPDAAARKGDLRLDLREGATADLGGVAAIVPGAPEESLLLERVRHRSARRRMPPPESGLSLDEGEVALLERWIAEGALFERHWAFVPPARPAVPEVAHRDWVRTELDAHVLRALEELGVEPNEELPEERSALLRRVTLDLTGIPPTPEEYRAALAAGEEWDYAAVVDRLLASPRYGERMAWEWLDAARYADTDGFQGDPTRQMWPWRDWLVRELNANTPFDRLTREMLAGDLLPDATPEQRLASGFNRNHMTNGEGGRILEETRVENVFDRVETTATVWLGLTFQCARCHDHKYDPVSQRDYYRLADFFNQTSDTGRGDSGRSAPNLRYLAPEVRGRLEQLEEERAELLRRQDAPQEDWDRAQRAWERELAARLAEASVGEGRTTTLGTWWRTRAVFPGPAAELFARVEAPELGVDLEDAELWREAPELVEGEVLALGDAVGSTYLFCHLDSPDERSVVLSLGSDDAIRVWQDGTEVLARDVARGVRPDQERLELRLGPGGSALLIKIVNTGGASGVYFRRVEERVAGLPLELAAALLRPANERSPDEVAGLRRAFRSAEVEPWQRLEERVAALDQERARLEGEAPVVLVMDQLPGERRRETRVLERGGYDRPTGEPLEAGVPGFLPPLHAADGAGPPTRLDLAEWLLDPANPLTARVIVNREWQRFFGRGLVATPEDLGRQGDAPSHPGLLDELATGFVESGWDLKALHRRIVQSAVYRQGSRLRPDAGLEDPDNVWLARGPRRRMPSWMLRDQALALSGLLVEQVGGPPVRPYQPEGVWAEATFDTIRYTPDTGEALYRRSLYVFWRRIVSPTVFFDTGKRQVCEVRPTLTNTPLHALVTLNDPTHVEAARHLAGRAWRAGEGLEERLRWPWFAATGREPDPEELDILRARWEELLVHYAERPDEAEALLRVGDSPRDAELPSAEGAALTVLCSIVLNLDEVLCR
jgi:hypothetical protein